MLKYCKLCKRNVEKLTRDHIIPKSIIYKIHHLFDMDNKFGPYGWNNTKNYRMVCKECNECKADRLDWSEQWTRDFMQHLVEKIQKNLDKYR